MNIFHTASQTLSPTAAFTCLFINCNGGSDSVSVSLVARHFTYYFEGASKGKSLSKIDSLLLFAFDWNSDS